MNNSLKVIGSLAMIGSVNLLWKRLKGRSEINQSTFTPKYGPWAIVTGSARKEGIGYGFARQLAAQKINLILIDILEDELHQRAQTLRQQYQIEVKPVVLDLGQRDFLNQLTPITDSLEIGLLICNHTYTPTDTPPIFEMELDTHHKVLDINARAYTTLVHHYGRHMVSRQRGGILLVASQAGLNGTPYTGAYSANKAFQIMLGEALWYEARKHNIDVLILTPGLTRTQGDALDDYPQFLLMEVDPVVRETLAELGHRHLVLPGPINKTINWVYTHLLGRQRTIKSLGDLMAQGLGK